MPASPIARVGRPVPQGASFPRALWRTWNAVDGDGLAAAVAFYAMLSLAPLVILVVAVGSAWLGEEATRHYVAREIAEWIGADGAALVDRFLSTDRDWPSSPGDWRAWAGVAVLAIGATATFAQLQHALDRIFGETDRPALLELVRVRALSFLLVLGTGLLLGVSLVASSALRFIVEHGGGGGALRMARVDHVVSFGVALIAMAALLRVLPGRPPRGRPLWAGALVGAMLFAAGRYLVAWYVTRFSLGSAYGAAGTVVVVMAWIFFSALVFLVGAVLARVATSGEAIACPAGSGAAPCAVTDAPGS